MICFNVPESAEGGACCAEAKVTQEIKTRESIADVFVIVANVSPTDLFSANVLGMSVISGKAILLICKVTLLFCKVTFLFYKAILLACKATLLFCKTSGSSGVLPFIKMSVRASASEQFAMRSFLEYTAVVDHQNPVGGADRR